MGVKSLAKATVQQRTSTVQVKLLELYRHTLGGDIRYVLT
jgi:hypothetical protein